MSTGQAKESPANCTRDKKTNGCGAGEKCCVYGLQHGSAWEAKLGQKSIEQMGLLELAVDEVDSEDSETSFLVWMQKKSSPQVEVMTGKLPRNKSGGVPSPSCSSAHIARDLQWTLERTEENKEQSSSTLN